MDPEDTPKPATGDQQRAWILVKSALLTSDDDYFQPKIPSDETVQLSSRDHITGYQSRIDH